jgi:hypothetical protein
MMVEQTPTNPTAKEISSPLDVLAPSLNCSHASKHCGYVLVRRLPSRHASGTYRSSSRR